MSLVPTLITLYLPLHKGATCHFCKLEEERLLMSGLCKAMVRNIKAIRNIQNYQHLCVTCNTSLPDPSSAITDKS